MTLNTLGYVCLKFYTSVFICVVDTAHINSDSLGPTKYKNSIFNWAPETSLDGIWTEFNLHKSSVKFPAKQHHHILKLV